MIMTKALHYEDLEAAVDAIAASYDGSKEIDNLESAALPNRRSVIAALDHLKNVIYLGFYSTRPLSRRNLRYAISEHLYPAYELLTEQIRRAVEYERSCARIDCVREPGWDEAVVMRLFNRIPTLRAMLNEDASAAFGGDPAAPGVEEVIFSYPAIQAITTYRIAHELYTLGVPYAGIWSLVAGTMSLIPIFGTILSSAPMIGVSIFTTEPSGLLGLSGFTLAFATLGWIVIIHFIETSILEPKIIGKHAKIHPVLVLFALLAGEHFFGVPGLIFAVPVLSVVQTLFMFLKEKLFEEPSAAAATDSDPTG